jgi:hypothetical protein
LPFNGMPPPSLQDMLNDSAQFIWSAHPAPSNSAPATHHYPSEPVDNNNHHQQHNTLNVSNVEMQLGQLLDLVMRAECYSLDPHQHFQGPTHHGNTLHLNQMIQAVANEPELQEFMNSFQEVVASSIREQEELHKFITGFTQTLLGMNESKLSDSLDSPKNDFPSPSLDPSDDWTDSPSTSPRNRRQRSGRRLPSQSTGLLKRWIKEHSHHPYPTEQEKVDMMDKTGMNLKQINNWFINARRRYLPKSDNNKEMMQQ